MMLEHACANGRALAFKRPAPQIDVPPCLSRRQEERLNIALLEASRSDDCGRIFELLKKGARLDAKNDAFHSTPLICAASEGQVDALRTLLAYAKKFYSDHPTAFSAFLELRDMSGWTALQWARALHHGDIVGILRDYGAKG